MISTLEISTKFGTPTDIILSSGDIKRIFVSTSKGYILIYTVKDRSFISSLNICKSSIRKLCSMDNGKIFAATETPGEMFLVEEKNFYPLSYQDGDVEVLGTIIAACSTASVKGSKLFLGNESGDVFCCEILQDENYKLLINEKYDHHDDYISCLAVSRVKKTLLVGSGDGCMSVIDLKKKRVIASTKNFEQDVTSIVIFDDEKRVALTLASGAIRIFKWNYWGEPCDSLVSKFHTKAPINMIGAFSKKNDVSLKEEHVLITATDDGDLRMMIAGALETSLKSLYRLESDSIERFVIYSEGPERKDEMCVAFISATDNLIYFHNFSFEAQTSTLTDQTAETFKEDESEEFSDSDSDKDDTERTGSKKIVGMKRKNNDKLAKAAPKKRDFTQFEGLD